MLTIGHIKFTNLQCFFLNIFCFIIYYNAGVVRFTYYDVDVMNGWSNRTKELYARDNHHNRNIFVFGS